MFNKFYNYAFLAVALAIITVNAVVLGKIAYNKGTELSSLTLTERELALPYNRSKENSGMNLRIVYRVQSEDIEIHPGITFNETPLWLDTNKMLELGFTEEDLEPGKEDEYKMPVTKERVIALEYNGSSYQKELERVKTWHAEKSAEGEIAQKDLDKRLNIEQQQASRLIVIDAATDVNELLEKYSGSKNMLYAKAIISTYNYAYSRNYDENQGQGYIRNLSIREVNLQRAFVSKLKDLPRPSYDKVNSPRYKVNLTVGQGLEPFIEDVNLNAN